MSKLKKIENLEKKLGLFKETLSKYRKMFEADGHVDTEEQKKLDKVEAKIQEIEAKLSKIKSGKKDEKVGSETETTTISKEEDNEILDKMEAIVNKYQEVVVAWNDKLNSNNSNIA